jgi:hypothetical protein
MDIIDPLGASAALRKSSVTREIFDPDNPAHRNSLKHFLKKGSWAGPQFYVEYPCSTVPETVLRKMALKGLQILDEN